MKVEREQKSTLSDVAAERGILCGVCKYGKEAYYEVADLVKAKDFTEECNTAMFACLSHLVEHTPEVAMDFHVVLSAANELGLSHVFTENQSYINRLFNFSVEFPNLRPLAKKIKKLSVTRELISVHDETRRKLKQVTGEESIGEIIAISEGAIHEYVNSLSANQREIIHISDGLHEFMEVIAENPKEIVGISSGLSRWDKAIGGGLRRKTVTIIAARPKIGKTTIADRVALHVAGNLKTPVLMLDTEMDEKGHWPRILARLTKIKIEDLETGRYVKMGKKPLVDKAIKKLQEIPFMYVNVSGREPEEIISIARRWVMQHVGFRDDGTTNDCLLIYDYLKLMNDNDIKSGVIKEHQALGFRLMELNDFVIKYDIPCLSFVQVNRDGLSKETSDIIADSDRILRYATSISLYKVKEPEEIAEDTVEHGNRKMIIIGTRYGGGLEPGDYINLNHQQDICVLEEVSSRNEAKFKRGIECENFDTPVDI